MLLLTREEEKLEEGRLLGIEEGMAKGEAQGIRKANLATARRLREMGMNNSDIHKITELSLEEIKNI